MKPFTLGLLIGKSVRNDPAQGLKLLCSGKTAEREQPAVQEKLDLATLLPEGEPYHSIAHAVATGNVAVAKKLAAIAVQEGIDPLSVALEGLLKGMDAVSVLYTLRQAFVPEVILSARALRAGLEASGSSSESIGHKGVVLLHTADGDLHDIGKNIVGAIVEANGYRVIDLGTSVDSTQVFEAIRQNKPIAVLGSSLMTSTRDGFLSTADRLVAAEISIPFIIGGGACDRAFATQRKNILYAKDPHEVVKILDDLTVA